MTDGLEFLGGKYEKTEQIDYGTVQTFRARNVATGKPVYIHRVSIAEEQPQQAALLRLLMTAMFRSSTVRKLVLDFGEEKGYWYVITESEPRCLLLREWLQFEIDNAAPAAAAPPPAAEPPAVRPVQKIEMEAPPGEFTRVFRRPPPTPSGPPAQAAAEAPAAHAEPGEFTRFFKGGLPPSKPASPIAPLRSDRPSNPELQRRQINAQRPSTPVPLPVTLPPARASDSGEFTRMFSGKPQAQQPFARPSEPARSTAVPDNIFDTPLEAPTPMPSATQQPGEYTMLFGKGEIPPPIQKPAAVAEPRSTPIVDDAKLFGTRPLAAMPAAPVPVASPPPAAAAGPSEYTMMSTPSFKVVSPPMPVAPAMHAPVLPTAPAVPKPPPMPTAAASGNKKLIILFASLGALTLLLVALMIFLTKK